MALVLVPTPLGNLRDITLRALDALRDAELIVAEDTRVARKLLGALGITAREIWSYREQNARSVTPGILERARNGLVAVTADAGMPGISDPGSALVAAAREAGIAIEVLPGPSAVLGVALLSGFPLLRFSFEGFPPRARGTRRSAFKQALRKNVTTIWYESPQRILASLADLAAVAPGAQTFLVREYTKLHEQHILGTPESVAAALPEPLRGEIAFAVAPYEGLPNVAGAASADAEIDRLLAGGLRVSEIARGLAERGLGDRRELYARAVARKGTSASRPETGCK